MGKISPWWAISILLMSGVSLSAPANFAAQILPLSPAIQQKIQQYTWHPGCPIPISQLVILKTVYWGMDQQPHQGTLIVNNALAENLALILQQLYSLHFPIANMRPIYTYQGNETVAMADNDTFVFHCRAITGTKNIYSRHAFGAAIDINTLYNPYVKGNVILPPEGKKYLNLANQTPGMLRQNINQNIIACFKKAGWTWGGDWQSLKDYQHFEWHKSL